MNLEEYTEYKHKNFPATKKETRMPGETLLWYGKDQQEKDKTPEVMTMHLEQTRDWSNVDISYAWNSKGYRGPEPNYNANRKILFAGGSMLLGVGLPLEETLPEVLAKHYDADYINLSDYDSLTELTEPLKKMVDYNPNYVIIGDTRFVVENNWLMAHIKILRKQGMDISKQAMHFFQESFNRTNKDILNIFSNYVENLFPNAKIVFLIAPRKNFKFETGLLNQVTLTQETMIDLSRDGVHPGPNTIKLVAQNIIRKIDE